MTNEELINKIKKILVENLGYDLTGISNEIILETFNELINLKNDVPKEFLRKLTGKDDGE